MKRLESSELNDDHLLEECDTGLFSLNPIKKGDLVGSFLTHVRMSEHFLRHSSSPNCTLVGRDVFAADDINAESELTIFYSNQE